MLVHNPRFIQVPVKLLEVYLRELKPGELKVLLVLVWENQVKYFPAIRQSMTRKQLAYKSGLSQRSVSESIKTLEGLGLIKIYDEVGRSIINSKTRIASKKWCYELGFPQ